jgi:hypothetical protein
MWFQLGLKVFLSLSILSLSILSDASFVEKTFSTWFHSEWFPAPFLLLGTYEHLPLAFLLFVYNQIFCSLACANTLFYYRALEYLDVLTTLFSSFCLKNDAARLQMSLKFCLGFTAAIFLRPIRLASTVAARAAVAHELSDITPNGAWSAADSASRSAVRFSCSGCRPKGAPPATLSKRPIFSSYPMFIINSSALW